MPAMTDRFLVGCFLIACVLPVVHVNFSPGPGNRVKSEAFISFLLRRSSNFLQSGFAGCELPLYETCHQNVSRKQCSAIGCCFHKQTCYRKAVPTYVRVFIILILLVLISFTLFEFYSYIVEKRRRSTARHLKNGSELNLDDWDPNEKQGENMEQEKKTASLIIQA